MKHRNLMKRTFRSRRSRGAGIVEFLIVAPLLLLLGLGLVQTGMVFHSKSSLNFALQQGARVGSVNNGDVGAIGRGIREGLVPFMGGGRSDAEILQTARRVEEEFQLGSAAGWIRVRQLSPTQQSFSDWAVDAYDEQGNRIREIPNGSLAVLRCTQAPNGGASGTRASSACPGGGEPIGPSSQQTLADANLLKLNLTYGVKLSVPLVNRMVAGVLSMAAGCRANAEQRLGALNLGATTVNARPDNCAYYNAVDARGRASPRIPVNLSVTVRMQSPARFAGNGGWFARVNRDRGANTGGTQFGNGAMLAATQFDPVPVSQLNPMGVTLANDTRDGLGNNVLAFGSDTDWSARLTSGGGGPGSGTGETPLCTPGTEEQAPGSSDESSTGVLGSIWNALTGMATTAYNFVRGFWDGFKQQIGDLVDALTDPVKTAQGLYELARAFIDDPVGTARMIGEALGRDLQQLAFCGAYDKGRVLGNYISPAFMLKVAAKLARFGRAGLNRALLDTKRELGCASFGPGTIVRVGPGDSSPIETLRRGAFVESRSALSYLDASQKITHVFGRTAPSYYRLITPHEEFKVTDEHPFWRQGSGWTKVRDLRAGDTLATANGDTLVVDVERVAEPIEVHNFSVDSTESYFVGDEGLWVHNTSCILRRPYSAPRSPGNYATGATDGGPGAWNPANRGPPNARTDYQVAVTGAPRNPADPRFIQEYRVNGVDFDGYDAQRGVLTDAKRITDNCPLAGNCPEVVTNSVRADWTREAERQIAATARSNTPIEWVVSNENMSIHVSELLDDVFRNRPELRDRITVIVVLTEDIVP